MGQTISSLVSSFENNAEKEKLANDSLNSLIEMAKLQLERFNLSVQTNIGNQKLIPVNMIIQQENILQASTTNDVENIGEIISDNFSAFATGDIANGVSTLIKSGLKILLGNYSGNVSSRDTYIITTGELGGITRIDIHFFAYRYTASQLTEICKQVISVSVVVSSVDATRLDDSTLKAIVQMVYGGLPVDDQKKILSQLQAANTSSLNSGGPSNAQIAASLTEAVRKVNNSTANNSKATSQDASAQFTINTTMGQAGSSASRFQDYLRGGIIEHCLETLPSDLQLSQASVLCVVPTASVSDSLLYGDVHVVMDKKADSKILDALPTVIQKLLQQAQNDAISNLPITSFTIGKHS